jgi:hypothetical protein
LDPLIKSQLLYQLSYAPGPPAIARGRRSVAKHFRAVQGTGAPATSSRRPSLRLEKLAHILVGEPVSTSPGYALGPVFS